MKACGKFCYGKTSPLSCFRAVFVSTPLDCCYHGGKGFHEPDGWRTEMASCRSGRKSGLVESTTRMELLELQCPCNATHNNTSMLSSFVVAAGGKGEKGTRYGY